MTSAVLALDNLLDQMNLAAEEKNWESLALLDTALREAVASFTPDAPAEEIQPMLDTLTRAKAIYTHVLHLCQRQRTELRQQSQALQQGRKAAHSYLTQQAQL